MYQLKELQDALGARYVIERELGHGGMARVYLARDSKLNRLVAVKVLKEEIASAVGGDRFLREIQIAARLAHPNILTLIDSGELDGLLYYVMPYVEGESLREKLRREEKIPVDEAVRIGREVAAALQYAHDHGVIHRDIKPENILLSGGDAFVSDFGVARAVTQASDAHLTVSGHVVGTPLYMSPEQASGERDLDGRTDIYALSCVLYEMVTGQPPHTGSSVQAVIAGHMVESPTPIRELAPLVPEPFIATIERGLAKRPEDRFDSAADLIAGLEVVVPPSRGRSVWLRAAVLAVLAVALSLSVWHYFNRGYGRLDPNKIVVFPLADRSAESDFAGSGLDVAIAVEMAFEYRAPLKWIDGWDRLSAEVRRDPTLLNAGLARAIALDVGAGYYVDGTLRTTGDSISVFLRLHDVAGDSIVTGSTAEDHSATANFAALGQVAVVGLLGKLLDPGRDAAVPQLAGRNPQALALWIAAEREYRLGQFESALELYEEAVAEDSLLVLPALKGALAATWVNDEPRANVLAGIAADRDSLLPTHYALLAKGVEAYLAGQADTAVNWYRRALAVDSLFTEALMQLGEIYHHMFPSERHLDSLAAAAFDRVLAIDSGFTPARYQLALIETQRGHWQRAEAHLRYLEAVRFSRGMQALRLMVACSRDGPESIRWQAEANENSAAVLIAGEELAAGGASFACAEPAFRAVIDGEEVPLGHRWGAVLGLQGVLVATGRVQEAIELLDWATRAVSTQAYTLYTVDLLAETGFELAASRVADLATQYFGEDYAGAGPSVKWQMGVYRSRYAGSAEFVQSLYESVRATADETGDRRTGLLADALAGHAAFARADTVRAIELYEALVPTAPYDSLVWEIQDPLAVEKLRLARLLLRRGEYQRAYDVASLFDHPQPTIYVTYLAASLSIRMRAAAMLGNSELAEACRQRLIGMGRLDLVESG